MTRRATVTQAQLKRMIKAALDAGQRVVGITKKPDGSVTVETAPLAPAPEQESLEQTDDVVL